MTILQVTGNLAVALRDLKRLGETRLIFISAIFINQNDVFEMISEVSKMSFVHNNAREVIA